MARNNKSKAKCKPLKKNIPVKPQHEVPNNCKLPKSIADVSGASTSHGSMFSASNHGHVPAAQNAHPRFGRYNPQTVVHFSNGTNDPPHGHQH